MIDCFKIEEEEKVLKSIARIAEYYVRAAKYISRYLRDYTEEIVYKKNTTKLPDSFKNEEDFIVLNIGKYDSQNSKLWQRPDGSFDPILKQKYCNITFECHIDINGNVLSVCRKT